MHRARFSSLIAVSALLSVPALAKDGDQPLTGSFAPTQIHKLEAASKATALARVRLGFAPMVLIDQAGFDAVHYEIKLAIDEEALEVLGQVTMTARTRAAGFDSPNLNLLDELIVDSVKSGGQGISWYHGGDFVHATLPQPKDLDEEFQVTIYYHGHPPEGGFQGFLFGSHLGVPMISTLSEPYMAQSWWPCKDTPSDKADSVDMRVTVNSSLYAVSNGLLRDSTDNGDGTTTYHWHEAYPITTYLVSLAITNFARFTEWYHHGADSMPVMFYSYPENLSSAETWWPISVSQIGAFAQIFGEYPFVNEKYGIAHFTWGGAMEHQTVSSHTSSTFGFDQYVTAHELAHQWWGDMVTCRDWHHIWLNEGFASYSEALWAEHNGGISAYRSYMNSMQYWQGGRIYIDDTTSVWNIFSTRVYDKGAWVLHMLRGMLSDSVFFDVLRAYYDHPNHQYKDAVTEDFRDLAEAVAGQDLDWFFEDWVYGYYYPKYYYSWASRSRVDGRYNLFVHLRQTQTTSPQVFRMPVDLVLAVGSARDTVRVWNDARDRDYWFVTDAPASISQLDPLDWILDQSYPEPYGLQIVSETLQTVDQFADHVDSVIAICGDPGAAISYSIAAGALPAGLELDSLTGLIGGRSLSASSTEVTIRAAAPGYQPATRTYSIAVTPAPYIPGDQNADGTLDIRDAVELIDYVFRGGFAPTPLNAADPSGDCVADVADVVALIEHVFRGGPIPWLGCLE